MFCSKCGKEMEDGSAFCSACGSSLTTTFNVENKNSSAGIVALVLGIVGLLAWIIPIIGLPVGVVALVFGIIGIKKSSKGMSIAGLVLGILCLVLTIINSAIGAYQGFRGEAWFQQKNDASENITESQLYEEQEDNVFTLRDKSGNILMTGGIESVGISSIDNDTGVKSYAVEIMFTKSASEQFAKITEENVGECIGIYINEDMISNPRVMSVITGGSCCVEVSTYDEAQKLADTLENCE
ncbi:MAG: zinc-ribbon domain-containing protein [Butyribacter sp.]|nr:zinc-ribbon domain-containing protein [Butyribacter sp.]